MTFINNFFDGFLKTLGLTTLVVGFRELIKFLTPPRWDSWQTLLVIAAYSWLFSLFARNAVIQTIIASIAWIFLISGLHWSMYEKKIQTELKFNGFFIGPWLTGALVCVFLWGLFGDILNLPISVPIVCWPPIAAAIAVAPKFIATGPDGGPIPIIPKAGDRQQIVILLLSNLLISCWVQFYFSTQTWLRAYPTLLVDDWSNSGFMIRLPVAASQPQRGVQLLENAEVAIRNELSSLSWSQVERWLFEVNQQLPRIRRAAFSRMISFEEDSLWSLEGQVVPGNNYRLALRAVWQGPTADGTNYFLTKTCEILQQTAPPPPASPQPVPTPPLPSTLQTVKIECQPVQGPVKIQIDDRPDIVRSDDRLGPAVRRV
jgi:hypothetical protein